MKRWTTRGEAFLGRELKKERRAGVDHYVVGQHLAEKDEMESGDPNIEVAVLSYVSTLGAVRLPVVRVFGGEWEPALRKCRVAGLSMDYGIRNLPDDWELTEEMKAALAKLDEKEN